MKTKMRLSLRQIDNKEIGMLNYLLLVLLKL